ncbi:MAG: energy-coupling factor ABC transporter permease [bacterium]
MHIPNQVLSCPVTYASAAAASGGVILAIRRLKEFKWRENAKTICALFAFIFVVQMVDVQIPGGTTAHFFGGMLAALIVGPMAATILMASILIAQCAFLHDGGFTALGANILNMAVIGPWAGWAAYQMLARHASSRAARAAALFAASWVSIVVSAGACALELAASGPMPIVGSLTAMAGTHAIVGLGEGLLTVACAGLASIAAPSLASLVARSR